MNGLMTNLTWFPYTLEICSMLVFPVFTLEKTKQHEYEADTI